MADGVRLAVRGTVSTVLFAGLAAALLAIATEFSAARWPAFVEGGGGSILRLPAGAEPVPRAAGGDASRLVVPGALLLARFGSPAGGAPASASSSAVPRAGRAGGDRRRPPARRPAGRPAPGREPGGGPPGGGAPAAPAPGAAVAPPPSTPAPEPAREQGRRPAAEDGPGKAPATSKPATPKPKPKPAKAKRTKPDAAGPGVAEAKPSRPKAGGSKGATSDRVVESKTVTEGAPSRPTDGRRHAKPHPVKDGPGDAKEKPRHSAKGELRGAGEGPAEPLPPPGAALPAGAVTGH